MPIRRAYQSAVLAFALLTASLTRAQTTTQRFEVASIKPSKSESWKLNFTPTGLSAKAVLLRYVLQEAYGIYDSHMWSGGPAWIDSAKFDIEARYENPQAQPTREQRKVMLQQLLADRFKVVVHHEAKEFSVYALVVAKNGPKFRESKPESILHDSLDGAPQCLVPRTNIGLLAYQGCVMHDLVARLSGDSDVGRPVIDKTGLTARYDFELHWMPDDPTYAAKVDPGTPSIFTAMQEQLGLKLEPAKAPLDTIVIDHAEMPSEN
jgi:uncharacterized protein (TIGR03435 family)